jgi:hypothetical protein
LHPSWPVGQSGGGVPSAFNRIGVENAANNTIDVAKNQKSLFTVHLL